MTTHWAGRTCVTAIAVWACALVGVARAGEEKIGYRDTPMLPGGQWHVHDSERPQPQAVTPATESSPAAPGQAPSDAIILFDGTDLSKWRTAKGENACWKVENGVAQANGTGDIFSREEFGDCQVHVEWATPNPPQGDIMNRGNSGVFLMGLYEIQVFESYHGGIYADGQAAAVYGQYPPLVNATRKPGEWQTYDIIFTTPRFKAGKLETPAYVTVFHNGVAVHNHVALLGPTGHRILAKETPHPERGPLGLQDHNNPVRFRNVWVRPLKGYDE